MKEHNDKYSRFTADLLSKAVELLKQPPSAPLDQVIVPRGLWEQIAAALESARSSTVPIPAEWHEDMRKAWEREKLRADHLERELEAALSAIEPFTPEVRALLIRLADAGESGETMDKWPRYWPVQDEQGGCVACGAGTITRPAEFAEQHLSRCFFRMAYDLLRRADDTGVKP